MKLRSLQIAVLGLSLVSAGCYNNPHITEKFPGQGPEHVHARPSVGPGTTPGGSTAGPQPQPRAKEAGHTEPQPPGGLPGQEPGLHHAGAAEPVTGAGGHQSTAPARTGNEQGVGERGPVPHGEAQRH